MPTGFHDRVIALFREWLEALALLPNASILIVDVKEPAPIRSSRRAKFL